MAARGWAELVRSLPPTQRAAITEARRRALAPSRWRPPDVIAREEIARAAAPIPPRPAARRRRRARRNTDPLEQLWDDVDRLCARIAAAGYG